MSDKEGNRRRQAKYLALHRDEINIRRRRLRTNPVVRQQIVDYNRETRRSLKLQIFALLGDKCRHCGFTDVRALQIDHRQGGGKKEIMAAKAYITYYRKVIKDLSPYQLLCANCNWIKRWENKETGKVVQYE